MLKVDTKHPEFKQIVLASSGIGAGYMDRLDYLWQKQNYKNINVATYTFRNGTKMAMPKYYKNKILTDKEREKMWINNLNRGLLWIYGEKVKADDWKTIDALRAYMMTGCRQWFSILIDNHPNSIPRYYKLAVFTNLTRVS